MQRHGSTERKTKPATELRNGRLAWLSMMSSASEMTRLSQGASEARFPWLIGLVVLAPRRCPRGKKSISTAAGDADRLRQRSKRRRYTSTVAEVGTQDVPISFDGLGSRVQASNTVAIHKPSGRQAAGRELCRGGQRVKAGDVPPQRCTEVPGRARSDKGQEGAGRGAARLRCQQDLARFQDTGGKEKGRGRDRTVG